MHTPRRCLLLLALLAACQADEATIQVAAPTGDRATDQASLRTALAAVTPGGTVQFGTGTYLIGGSGIAVATPDVRLAGHPDGTVLQGCTTDQIGTMSEEAFFAECRGLFLTGGRQAVSGLTFEQFNIALTIMGLADSSEATPLWNAEGGHLIEDNTFRNSVSLETYVHADSAVIFRRNRFRNTYHAIAIMGGDVHFLENDVAAPEPGRVPFGWPSLAIGVRPQPGMPCSGIRIEENSVTGHTDAVVIGVLPPDGPGGVCEGISVLNNTIQMLPVVHSKEAGPMAGTPAVGVPIRLINLQAAVGTGAMTFPMPAPPGGWPASFADAAVRNNVVEGNQIDGAKGVAIELIFASGNRVVNNRIGAVTAFTDAEYQAIAAGPFGIGPGFWLKLGGWPAANGTGVWMSQGSEGNTVMDNGVPAGR